MFYSIRTLIIIFIYHLLLLGFALDIVDNYLLESAKYSYISIILGFLFSFGSIGLVTKEGVSMISKYFFTLQIIFVLRPASVCVSIQGTYSFLNVSFILVILYFMKGCIDIFQNYNFRNNNKILLDKYTSIILFIIITLITIYSYFNSVRMLLLRGIDYNILFSIKDLYTMRSEVFNAYSTFDFVLIYFLAYFINPILLLYAYSRKSIFFFALALASIFLVFFATAMKTYIFISFIVLISYIFLKSIGSKGLFNFVLITVISLLLISFQVHKISDIDIFSQLVARSIFEPGRLQVIWIDYFQNVPNESVFDLNPAPLSQFNGRVRSEVIADFLGGSTGNGEGANSGFIASSFATYGFIGCIIHSLFLSFVLATMNYFFDITKGAWYTAISLSSLYLLTNISFVGAVFYYGLGLCYLILLMRKVKIVY